MQLQILEFSSKLSVNAGYSHDDILFRMPPSVDLIPPDDLYLVELRDSKIHGQGLFATCDIQKGLRSGRPAARLRLHRNL